MFSTFFGFLPSQPSLFIYFHCTLSISDIFHRCFTFSSILPFLLRFYFENSPLSLHNPSPAIDTDHFLSLSCQYLFATLLWIRLTPYFIGLTAKFSIVVFHFIVKTHKSYRLTKFNWIFYRRYQGCLLKRDQGFRSSKICHYFSKILLRFLDNFDEGASQLR